MADNSEFPWTTAIGIGAIGLLIYFWYSGSKSSGYNNPLKDVGAGIQNSLSALSLPVDIGAGAAGVAGGIYGVSKLNSWFGNNSSTTSSIPSSSPDSFTGDINNYYNSTINNAGNDIYNGLQEDIGNIGESLSSVIPEDADIIPDIF